MTVKLLQYAEYEANAKRDPQWKSYAARWDYHSWAIEIIQGLDISGPNAVLEIGAFGAGLVHGSKRMDLPHGSWPPPDPDRQIWHDARDIPWPFQDVQFEMLIALRVWHHLVPAQERAFREARRVARRVLITCPEHEIVGVGIPREKFTAWGGLPVIEEDLGAWGKLYLFGDSNA
jgi:hypothetical protein